MKSIFGRINVNQVILDQKLFETGISQITIASSSNIEKQLLKNAGFGQVHFRNDGSSERNKNPSFFIYADCRLDNKHELIDKFELCKDTSTDDQIILESFKKWSYDCPNHLLGDFAFAIWDDSKQELFCARDHFGVKPFFYSSNKESFIFSSEISAILTQTDLKFTIDDQYVADSLSIVKSEKDRTTYCEIKKLPPAHSLILKQDELILKEFWKLEQQESLNLSDKEIIEQFKNLLFKSVSCRLNSDLKTGAELSGGIDSSTIAAIASKFTDIETFSHVLPDHLLGKIFPFKDEQEFINQLTEYCQIDCKRLITSEKIGLVDALKNNLNDFKYLSQQNFSTFSDHLYQKASENGISVLLSGFGGDEMISSKGLGYLDELAFQGIWAELKLELKNRSLSNLKFTKRIIKYFLKTKLPTFYNILTNLIKKETWWKTKFENLALNANFSVKMNVRKRYFNQYNKREYRNIQQKNIAQITNTHVSHRLEYCAITGRKYGIEYRYPFLDKRLIEFYLSIPSRLKAKNGQMRFAIRKAIDGLVPQQIQWRMDKTGSTIPTVYMRMINDKEKIANIITKAKTNQQITKYIDLDKYEEWFNRMSQRLDHKSTNINPGAFYNYLKLILFIEQNPSLFK